MESRLKRAATVALLFLTPAVLVPAQQASTTEQAPTTELASAPAIPIGPGDMIEVAVYGQNELSGRFRVNEKGDVLVPLLGPIHVAGMTADETALNINDRYIQAEILSAGRPHVTVFISEYATQGIVVNGEVKSPGLYPALGVRMLNDVLTVAGGVNPTASSKIIITHKNAPDHPMTVDYRPDSLPPVIPQVQILPGDTIMVPRAGLVYVAGNVGKSGAFVMDGEQPLTIERIMALVGWGGKAANLNHTHLIRTQKDGSREDIELNVNHIFKGKEPDIVLNDGDILFVPTSGAKLATGQAINSALGIGSSIAIYRTAVR